MKNSKEFMSCAQACGIIHDSGKDDVFVITMTAMKVFPQVAPDARYVTCAPLMGGAAGIATGICLAQPDERVWAIDGDASLLMELGVLVTVAESQPRNFIHVLCDNRVQYGGTANLAIPGAGNVDFCAMAKAAGYTDVFSVESAHDLRDLVKRLPRDNGPIFINARMKPDAAYYSEELNQREIPDSQISRLGDEGRRLLQGFLDGARWSKPN